MANNNKSKKSHTMGIRLGNTLHDKLVEYSNRFNFSKSEVFKNAFRTWSMAFESEREAGMIVVNKQLIALLFEMASKKKLEENSIHLSEWLIKNFFSYSSEYFYLMENRMDFQSDIAPVNNKEFALKILTKSLSHETTGLFDKIKYRFTSDDNILVFGLHSINYNFSYFTSYVIKKFIEKSINYLIVNEKSIITENSIILEFKLKRG